MTRTEAYEHGFDLYGFCKPEAREAFARKREAQGYTTVEFAETIAGFEVLFLGTKNESKLTRRERGLLCDAR